MLAAGALRRTAQWKDSYIAASTYIRCGRGISLLRSCRGFSCQHSPRSNEEKIGEPVTHDIRASEGGPTARDDRIEHYKKIFDLPRATASWERWDLQPNTARTIHGYVTVVRRGAKGLHFIDLVDPQLRKMLQLVVDAEGPGQGLREAIERLRPHTPVAVSGHLVDRGPQRRPVEGEQPGESLPWQGTGTPSITYHTRLSEKDGEAKIEPHVPGVEFKNNPYVGKVATTPRFEMTVESIKPLNHFPEDIVAQSDTNFAPHQRHLQLRTDSTLRKTLQARSKAQTECRKYLFSKGFDEMETPLLFKSTPEGAREFLVPTRQQGLSYALPQSPQQFKQTLMASGISKYFQFARCFRDEDMRADRQPEFTQLDLEMSFASAEDVMKLIERLIIGLWKTFFRATIFESPSRFTGEYRLKDLPPEARLYFPRCTYTDALTLWGSDKPDTRLGSQIHQVHHLLDPALKSKFTPLKDPIIDMVRVKVTSNPKKSREFVARFFDHPARASYVANPDGPPGIFIFDPSKPMDGLSVFEHEAVDGIIEMVHPQRGDLLVLQARPNRRFVGESSTVMGDLRRDLQISLVSEEILPVPRKDSFLWITDFPLFSPATVDGPGQGGKAGIKSTHHPFTAPRTPSDVEKLLTNPLGCEGEHFDLVINGVEIGGGSRRIHDSRIQEMVLSEVLKIPDRQVEQFRPLLEALRAGCPPHAGIALGFDRLMAILRNTDNVRDVITFPKFSNGEDKMFGAPSAVQSERWVDYHMVPERAGEKAP